MSHNGQQPLPPGLASIPAHKLCKLLDEISLYEYWSKEGSREPHEILYKRSQRMKLVVDKEELRVVCQNDDMYKRNIKEYKNGQKYRVEKCRWPEKVTTLVPVYDDEWCNMM